MSLFSRRSSNRNDSPDEGAFSAAPETPAPPLIDTAAIIEDPEKLRRYIMTSLLIESRDPTASSSSRVTALRSLADLALVSEETKYRVMNKDVKVTVSIERIAEEMAAAAARLRQQVQTLPAIEVGNSQ